MSAEKTILVRELMNKMNSTFRWILSRFRFVIAFACGAALGLIFDNSQPITPVVLKSSFAFEKDDEIVLIKPVADDDLGCFDGG